MDPKKNNWTQFRQSFRKPFTGQKFGHQNNNNKGDRPEQDPKQGTM